MNALTRHAGIAGNAGERLAASGAAANIFVGQATVPWAWRLGAPISGWCEVYCHGSSACWMDDKSSRESGKKPMRGCQTAVWRRIQYRLRCTKRETSEQSQILGVDRGGGCDGPSCGA